MKRHALYIHQYTQALDFSLLSGGECLLEETTLLLAEPVVTLAAF